MALWNGLSISKSPFTTRPRVDGPAPAEPAEMAEGQSRHFMAIQLGRGFLLDAVFAESCFIVATADIVATEVCQFQEDRVKQARCNFLVHASFEVISGVCSSNLFKFVLLGSSEFEFAEFSKFDFLVGHICTVIHRDRCDTFSMSPRDRASQGSKDFGDEISQKALYASSAGLCSIVFTIGTTATEVRQIHQDRGEQARCASLFRCSRAMSTADIVARKVCQFQKDRDEQARCASLFRYSRAMSTADIVAIKVRQFQKDRGEQARCASLFRYSRAMSAADIVAMKVCQFASLVLPIANVSLSRVRNSALNRRGAA